MWKKKAGCLLCGLQYDTRNIAVVITTAIFLVSYKHLYTNVCILQYQINNIFRVEAIPAARRKTMVVQ